MVGAAVLSIAFMIAVGPSLPTLCTAWCGTQAAGTCCHDRHHGSTTRMDENVSCPDQVLVAALYKEDARRRLAPEEQAVWPVVRSASRAQLTDLRALDRRFPQQSDQRSTGPTPLRI